MFQHDLVDFLILIIFPNRVWNNPKHNCSNNTMHWFDHKHQHRQMVLDEPRDRDHKRDPMNQWLNGNSTWIVDVWDQKEQRKERWKDCVSVASDDGEVDIPKCHLRSRSFGWMICWNKVREILHHYSWNESLQWHFQCNFRRFLERVYCRLEYADEYVMKVVQELVWNWRAICVFLTKDVQPT